MPDGNNMTQKEFEDIEIKRKLLIKSGVKILNTWINSLGYPRLSIKTLMDIEQEYIKIYQPPFLPKMRGN